MTVTPNHEFIVDQIVAHCGASAAVLDFGCGEGELVDFGRTRGLEMVGADIFQLDNDRRVARLAASGKLNTTVHAMPDGVLPFRDAAFDAVSANQVMEHVRDLDRALREIARVLRPGGIFLAINPTIEVWREGHCGIPFAHRLQRAPALQHAYLLAGRWLGLGFLKHERSRSRWAADFADYLQRFTTYRRERELQRAYERQIGQVRRLEPELAAHRWPRTARLPRIIRQQAVFRLGSMVSMAVKESRRTRRSAEQPFACS